MAKRFTDTRLYQKSWFRKLTPPQKCLWHWTLSQCDNAGVLDLDFELASFQIGAEVGLADLIPLEGKLELLKGGKYFITEFVNFQYGQLNDKCNPHKPVYASLKKYGLLKRVVEGYSKGIYTPEDKDKDKVKDKVKDKDKVNLDFDSAYKEYPKKMGRQKGIDKAKKEIKIKEEFILLVQAIRNYKKYMLNEDPKYFKHFSTFMGEWRDWTEEKEAPLSSPKIDKAKILRVLASGNTKVSEAKGPYSLSDEECDFLIDNGGLIAIGSMNEFNFNALFNKK